MLRRTISMVASAALLAAPTVAQQATPAQSTPAIRATSELVLVNVVVRDKKGNLIRDLKQEDFTVLEDGQKQQIASFDFENIEEFVLAGQQGPLTSGASGQPAAPTTADGSERHARDRRLLLRFVDCRAMDPDTNDR